MYSKNVDTSAFAEGNCLLDQKYQQLQNWSFTIINSVLQTITVKIGSAGESALLSALSRLIISRYFAL